MENKTKYLNIRVEKTDWWWLEHFAQATERSKSAVVRLAIKDFISRQKLDADLSRAHRLNAEREIAHE